MPLYYFNIHCGDFETTDLIGEDCATLEQVRSGAIRVARDLVLQELLSGRVPRQGWIEVEDQDHRAVLTLPISAAAS